MSAGIRWRLAKVLPWLILALGLLATWFVQRVALGAAYESQQENFASQTREIILRIEQRLAAYRQILYGARGLFAASERVGRDEFREYVSGLSLNRAYPGVQGVGFALVVTPSERDAHVAEIRKEGFPDYTLHPAGKRELYTSIIYLEPFADRNLRAFGYDMYSDPVRRQAMERSRDLNEAAISAKVTLVQEDRTRVQAGFLMYVPVYRKGRAHASEADRRANIVGWTYSPFRMGDLMLGILGRHPDDLELQIFDGRQTSPETLLYDSGERLTTPEAPDALYRTSQLIDVFGHAWTIIIASNARFEANLDTRLVRAIQLAGVLTSVLLSLLVGQLANSRAQIHRVLALADELRTSEERWQFALEGAGEGVWDWNLQTGEATYSRRWKELWGFSEAEIGDTADEWIQRVHPDDLAGVNAALQRHLDGEKSDASVEFRMFCKDGSWRWTLGRGRVVSRDARGQPLRLVGTNADITERKLHDEELKRSHAELEQFNYAIAHDMRQPLRMISSYLQLLEMNLAEQLDDEQRQSFDFAIDGAKRLDRMLLALLDFSRIGRLGEAAAIASRALVDEALRQLAPAIASATAQLRIEGEWPSIVVRHDQIVRLLQNLIDNAVKFRTPGRPVEVVIAGLTVGNDWCLSVADNGVGIRPDQLGRLFQMFQRLHSRTHYEGTGIGLALCRKIVENHGGQIWAESAGEGLGSRFCANLPFAVADPAQPVGF